jgi:hypothetical protein
MSDGLQLGRTIDALNQAEVVDAVRDDSGVWLLEHLRRTHSPPPVAFTAACIYTV